MAKRTKGKCKYCGKEYTFSYMNKHLSFCEERMKKWAEETATLKDVDQFLRDIWLECCGHLSAFEIEGISYDVAPQDDFFWGPPSKSMNYKLKTVLEKGMTFGYECDFGSTTELMITVVNYRVRAARKEKIIILSRNIRLVCCGCGEDEVTMPRRFALN